MTSNYLFSVLLPHNYVCLGFYNFINAKCIDVHLRKMGISKSFYVTFSIEIICIHCLRIDYIM